MIAWLMVIAYALAGAALTTWAVVLLVQSDRVNRECERVNREVRQQLDRMA